MVRQGFLARAGAGFCALILTVSPVSEQVLGEEAATPDSTGTQTITGNDYRRWPVRTIEDWLALQPGVAVRYPGADNIYIRGAERYNSAYILNGTRIEDPMTGQLAATISPYAIDYAKLRTRMFDGRHGDFTGGVVSISSAAWQQRVTGSVEVTSDYFGTEYDQNWYNATLAGPLGNNTGANFFVTSERRYLGDRRPSPIAEDVLPGGEQALPGNSREGWSHHGKITWAPCEKGQITLWGDYSRDNYQTYRHEWYYFPEHAPRTEDEMLSLGLGMERELTSKVSLDVKAKYYRFERTHGDGVVFDDLAAYQRGVPNPLYDVHNLFQDSGGGVAPLYDYYLKQKSEYLGVDGSVSVNLHRLHRVTLGFEARRYTVRQYEHFTPTTDLASRRNNYGYNPDGSESNSDSYRDGVKHPMKAGLFLQDHISFAETEVTAAVRLDYVDYSDRVFRDPEFPLGDDGNGVLDADELVDTEAEYRLSPRLSVAWQPSADFRVFASGSASYQTLPFNYVYQNFDFTESRINTGLYFPYPNAGQDMMRGVHLEAGGQWQAMPKLAVRLCGFIREYEDHPDVVHIQAIPVSYDQYANFAMADATGLDLGVSLTPTTFLSVDIDYTLSTVEASAPNAANVAFMNANGLPELKDPADRDQIHKAVGVIDFHTGPGEGPRIGNTSVFEDLSCVATVYAAGGFRYTRTQPYDAVSQVTVFREPVETYNASHQPSVMQVDLRLERTIRLGSYRIVPFVWIRNLLDRENVAFVYPGTGEPDETGYLDTPEGQTRIDDPFTGEEFLQRYLLRQNDPTNYAPPRQIYFGIRAEF